MDDTIRNKLLKQFAVGIIEASEIYIPAYTRLTWDELQKAVEYLEHRMGYAARALIREKMTLEELQVEKSRITTLLVQEADDQHGVIKLGQQVVTTIMTAALIAAVGL